MAKKAIYAEDLLAEIERQRSALHPCDRLEVANVLQIIEDFPAAPVEERKLKRRVAALFATVYGEYKAIELTDPREVAIAIHTLLYFVLEELGVICGVFSPEDVEASRQLG